MNLPGAAGKLSTGRCYFCLRLCAAAGLWKSPHQRPRGAHPPTNLRAIVTPQGANSFPDFILTSGNHFKCALARHQENANI